MELPEAFLNRMEALLGEGYGAFLSSLEEPPVRSLRINTLKCPPGFTASQILANPEPVSWEADAYYFGEGERPGNRPLHEAGAYYIQEASAMAAVPELDVQPGMKVLDLCASPGGKSVQIAMRLNGAGLLVSNEFVPSRALTLSRNLERMGVTNACVLNDTPKAIAEALPAYFDRVLVDAPCSGEGMFRKNNEAVNEWSEENVSMCADRQREILDAAVRALRPGGLLVYSTCTFEREEDEDQAAFLASLEGMKLLSESKLMPHTHRGEGQYVSLIAKAGDAEGPLFQPSSGQEGNAGVIREALRLVRENVLTGLPEGIISCSKNRKHVSITPVGFGPFNALKVLRRGVNVADVDDYGRITLSHSLAMCLKPENVRRYCAMGQGEALSYMRGEALRGAEVSCDGDGPVLMCLHGFSLGWGMRRGNIIKNFLPKGLRKCYNDSECAR